MHEIPNIFDKLLSINAQAQDAKTIRTIYDLALTQSEAYENLRACRY